MKTLYWPARVGGMLIVIAGVLSVLGVTAAYQKGKETPLVTSDPNSTLVLAVISGLVARGRYHLAKWAKQALAEER